MSPWSELARLDLGLVLSRSGPDEEAGEVLEAARDALAAINHPRQQEAEEQLAELRARRGAR